MQKLIHGIWHDENHPPDNKVRSWSMVNPDSTVKLWTFSEIMKLLPVDARKFVNSLPFLVQQADFLRLAVLDIFGGFYLDLDVECLNGFGQLWNRELIFGNACEAHEPMFTCTAVLAGVQRDPFWNLAMSEVITTNQEINTAVESVKTTGTHFVTGLVKSLGLRDFVEPKKSFFPSLHDKAGSYTCHYQTSFPRWAGKRAIVC